ncbi:PepSY domain-containing protein [Christiangramia fulva]|uniref:PepSY domain-containing protein n=1 Tax=Christiangramia fulva TaxID=2126553 RepID=A0A2R3Z1S4_9FLAO|nr:PepSY domain-containing protein [Christiangramia fulva]AVR44213.1 PepSY domain-containing protein [Christiangramia fulva]
MKNKKLNSWLWRWHVIAGLISLPFVLILSITGGIYLFKDNYEAPHLAKINQIKEVKGQPLSFQKQWEVVQKKSSKKPDEIILNKNNVQATRFASGQFATKSTLYLNPYSGDILAQIREKDSKMFKVRKLHGELLMGKFGTKIVELIACWLIVLIITGIYVWWPKKKWSLKGVFLIRKKEGRRNFFRDLHAVTAFWFSVLLLMILMGGLPWTDVFGDYFKWMQKVTHTGYPVTWQATNVHSKSFGIETIPLDSVIGIAKGMDLKGEIHIGLPYKKTDVFTVSNTVGDPHYLEIHHLDQFSGKEIVSHDWNDIGVLMRGRLWFMAFHQGQFGPWNKYLMLLTAIALFTLSLSAFLSYYLRDKKGWGIPKVPKNFTVGKVVIGLIILLSLLLPLFGLSVLLIIVFHYGKKLSANKIS